MVASISTLFQEQLPTLNVQLDSDTIEYITSVLNDLTMDDMTAVRESTEAFLTDANVNEDRIESFYDVLASKAKAESGSSTPQTKTTTEKAIDVPKPMAQPVPKEETSKSETEKASKPSQTSKIRGRRRQKRGEAAESAATDSDEPVIVATSQQSRFKDDIVLENSGNGIDLTDVNVKVNEVELVVGASLKLKTGTRYGLVGQNGVGKTVLMKVMAEKILVGLPPSINILHIAQLDVYDESVSVLDEVLASDRKVVEVIEEYDILQASMDSSKDATASTNQAVHDVLVLRQKRRLLEAQKIATKRSGARGRAARDQLIIEEKELADMIPRQPGSYVTEELSNKTVSDIMEKYALIDRDSLSAKASQILKEVGFTDEQMKEPVKKFSGGWRMRIALAKAQFIEPHVLLLDEPTNHLDLPAIVWLQDYVTNTYTSDNPATVVVVSHDREFLNMVTTETIIMRDKVLRYHAGNYDDWEKNTEEQRIRKQNMLEVQEKKKARMEESMEKNRQRAKATGDDKRMGMVKSREKKLERFGMEKTEDGKRYKVSYRAGYHFSTHLDIEVEKTVKTATIKIPEAPPLRYTGPIFQMSSVFFQYTKESRFIVKQCSLDIRQQSRIALLGPNGCGKTTILNLLVGKLSPTKGLITRHPNMKIGYFSQHIVDDLDPELTAVEAMQQRHPGISEHECRAHFGTVGVSGPIVLRKLKVLSGGQRNRVAFALMLYDSPHVMILDEITNHLDMGTVDMLVQALARFKGALVLVSHDVWFMKQVMEEQAEQEEDEEERRLRSQYYVLDQGKMTRWEKGMDAYVRSVRRGKS